MHKSLVIGLVVILRVSVLSSRYCLFYVLDRLNSIWLSTFRAWVGSKYPLHIGYVPGFSDTITTTNSSRNFLEAEVMYAHQTNWFNSLATFFCHSQKPLRPPFLMKIKQLQVWPKLANKLSKSSLSSTKNL